LFAGSYLATRDQEKFAQLPGKTAAAENGWQNMGQIYWPGSEQNRGNETPAFNTGTVHISNVKVLDNNPVSGEVEFTFDAITPMHIKGSVNDERVQKVLTHALLNDENPGVRLRSVSAIASQSETGGPPVDPEVKKALLKALRSDENPAVRKEALKALQKLPFDNDIKKAFLAVLLSDKNSGIRIAVINTLDSVKGTGKLDNDILEVMKQKMHDDDNNYIRLRAKAVVQEIRQ
jgi:hypothetical protein